jgi:hypothetical protein
VGILHAMLGRREPVVEYRTVDGGHPAPYPDMTDEQLYNYELAFNVPNKTFDRPPRPSVPQEPVSEPRRSRHGSRYSARPADEPQAAGTEPAPEPAPPHRAAAPLDAGPPLDLGRPVRTVTTKHPVEIVTTRARHPVYKVHAYIGADDVVTVFTLDGRLSENGPRFLENVPQKEQLFLNVYPHPDAHSKERFLLTQHATRAEADAQAGSGRIACVPVEFDL